MADFGKSLKGIWMKGMEAIGNTANSIAANTKFKVEEMNMLNRRTEILTDFGNKAYALFLKGERFPEELEKQLTELSELDEKLNSIRAEHITSLRTEEQTEEKAEAEDTAAAKEAEAADEAEESAEAENISEEAEGSKTAEKAAPENAVTEEEEKDEPVPVIRADRPEEPARADEGMQFSDAINELFEKAPSTEEIEKKVDSALDSMQENLQTFGKQISDGIDELTDKLNGPKE